VNSAPKAGQTVTLYRAFYEEYEDDPLPSRSAVGRFHDETGARATSYLAASPETAWREVIHRWQADKGTFRLGKVEVRLSNIMDLTDPVTRKRYDIDRESLTADDYRSCQELRRRLQAEGVEGIWTYSRADQPAGRQLVVLLDQVRKSSRIEVVHVGPVNV
jgi:RES domain-containing protein